MKPPPNNLHLFMFASLVVVSAAAMTPEAGPRGAFAMTAQSDGAAADNAFGGTVARRGDCRIGMRYSTYYRKCVLALPFQSG